MNAHGPLATKQNLTTRDLSVESLRGLAVILMVAGHVIGAEPGRGMGVADDSIWHYFYVGLADIRMPLFTTLSGYVYAMRPIGEIGQVARLMKGKARRLLVPLLTVGTVFFFVQLFVPGTNRKPQLEDLWKVYVYGIEHLWFLQAIFLIFLVVGVLDAFNILKSPLCWTMAVATASLLFLFVEVATDYNVFSVNGFLKLLPFFLVGYGINKFSDQFEKKPILLGCCAGFVVVYSVRLVTIAEAHASGGLPMRTLSLVVGLFAVSVLMLSRRRITIRWLGWIGQYSFGIYLLHVFGFAGIRILVLDNVGLDSHVPAFLICMVAAVGLPILFERIFGRVPWISWAILGQRAHTRPS